MHKIRTVAESGPPVWPTEDVPRRTRFGRLLRRFWLDEGLQLWDVIRGKMNLVGPRPEMIEYFAYFAARIPGYPRRTAVRPGLTGLAQVNGYRNDTDVSERLRLDLLYIDYRSTSGDLRILVNTIMEAITGRKYRSAKGNAAGFAESVTRAVLERG